jgi:transcription initiation factor IIE alpha subunit
MLHGSASFSKAVALKVACPRCGGELQAERD